MTRKRKPERCEDWPRCQCGQRWAYWCRKLPELCEPPPLTDEQWEAVLFDVVFMLTCLARHCPDAHMRRHATLQLMRPIFAEEAKRWLN